MGIFFKDKEKADELSKDKKPAQKTKPQVIPVVSIPQPTNSSPVKAGSDYNAHLDRLMRENNQPGLDYLEFADALVKIDGQPLTEEQKYTITFPSYQAMGVGADKLVDSAEHYVKLLEKEKEEFTRELTTTREANVNQKKAAIEQTQRNIEKATADIQGWASDVTRMNSEMNAAQATLAAEEMAFNNAFMGRVNLINSQIEKIKKYLTDGNSNG